MTKAEVGVMCSTAFAVVLTMGLPAPAHGHTAAKTGVDRSIEAPAADNVANRQTAQFTLPTPAPDGKAPAVQLPKQLTLEYAYGIELEIPYVRNADLDDSVADDFVTALPTLTGSITYRPTYWLETTGEMRLDRLIGLRAESREITTREEKRFSLFISQAFVKLKPSYVPFMPPYVPFEFTVGRRTFADSRLWLYDTELDAAIVTLKPGDFNIEASVSREELVDLDLLGPVPRGRITNHIVYTEYRGIEDHKLAAYWIERRDATLEEGRPQFIGARAHGRPSDEFNYWTELVLLRGSDELTRDFFGHGFELAGTYRFPNLPLQPSITLGYAYGSGDGNPNDNKNTEFRQTGLQSNEAKFGGVTQFKRYGEALDPELSNLQIFTAGVSFRPAAGIFVDLVYHHYRFNEIATEVRGSAITAELNQVASRLSKDVGNELDIILGFRNLFGVRGLGVDLRAGLFFPGDAYLRDDNGDIRGADKGISIFGTIFF